MRTPIFVAYVLCFTLVSLPALGAKKKKAGEFAGCQGSNVYSDSKKKSFDVSAELKASRGRVQTICEKELPKRLEKVKASANQCTSGRTDADRFTSGLRTDVSKLTYQIQSACKSMQEVFKVANDYCAERAAGIAAAQAHAEVEGNAGLASQEEALRRQQGVLNKASDNLENLAQRADAASKKIYQLLPNRDSPDDLSKSQETAETRDPKLSALVDSLMESFTSLKEGNKQAAACNQLASKSGKLNQIRDIVEKNLWPNGKRAARSLASLSTTDRTKAAGFDNMKDKVSTSADKLSQSDITDTEKETTAAAKARPANRGNASGLGVQASALQRQTPEEFRKLNEDADKAAVLQERALENYKKNGAKGPAAVTAAIEEAKKTPVTDADIRAVNPPSAARQAVTNLPTDGISPLTGKYCNFSEGRSDYPGVYNKFGVCERDTRGFQ